MADEPGVAVNYREFIGYKTALKSSSGLSIWRTWQEKTRRISFNPEPRRVICGYEDGYMVTEPCRERRTKQDEDILIAYLLNNEPDPKDRAGSDPDWFSEPFEVE